MPPREKLDLPEAPVMCWCPYLGKDVEIDATNIEHVIPLSLGGSNQFVIRVEKNINSHVGSGIDGRLANDFFTAIRRIYKGVKGHSNKPPLVDLKNTKIKSTGDPVKITFSEAGVRIWDPINNKEWDSGGGGEEEFVSTFKIDKIVRLKFMCKVALASGYFIYGRKFIEFFSHDELRAVMMSKGEELKKFSSFSLRAYDEFSDFSESDRDQVVIDKKFCSLVDGSCVILIPGESSVGFVIGIIGQWIGTLNVPAKAGNLPFDDCYDLGHAVIIENKKMRRISYRQMAREALEKIEMKNNTPGECS